MRDLINSTRYRNNEHFLSFLSFGFIASEEKAQERADWFANCLATAERVDARDVGLQGYIKDLLNQVVLDTLKATDSSSPLILSLSSGYDSRSILFVLRENRIPVHLYTFGQKGLLDFDLIKALDLRENLSCTFFDISSLAWSLEIYDDRIAFYQDFPVSPRVQIDAELGKQYPRRYEFQGYLNGNLTGQSARRLPVSWEQALLSFKKMNNPFKMQRFLGQNMDGLLPRKPLADPRALPLYRQMDLAYRTVQRIRPVNHQGTTYLLPYEDTRWIGFWLSRSFPEIQSQRLFLSFLRRLESALFYEINQARAKDTQEMRRHRIKTIYGEDSYSLRNLLKWQFQFKWQSDSPFINPTEHFPILACYKGNRSFRKLIEQSIARLKARRIFYESFVEDIHTKFSNGDPRTQAAMKGLVTSDILCQAGIF